MEYEKLLREKLQDTSSPQEAEEAGARILILYVLKRRIGTLPESLGAKLAALPIAQMISLAGARTTFQSIADLESWLNNIPE